MTIAIDAVGLMKSYGKKKALDGFSLKVNQGEILGIVGPNGAGKTTFIEMAEGLRTPDSGTITLMGLDPIKNAREVKALIGVQLQSTSLHPLATPLEIMKLYSSFYANTVDINELFSFFHLEDVVHTKLKDLSGGWRQRVILAVALLNDPNVVFLDEPTTGLDPNARLELWSYIRKLKEHHRTVIICTHYLDEAEKLCDRIAVINSGKVMKVEKPEHLIEQDQALINISVNGVPPEASLEFLTDVNKIGRDREGRLILSCHDSDKVLFELMAHAEKNKWKLSRIRIEEPTLDDIFMEIASGGDK